MEMGQLSTINTREGLKSEGGGAEKKWDNDGRVLMCWQSDGHN